MVYCLNLDITVDTVIDPRLFSDSFIFTVSFNSKASGSVDKFHEKKRQYISTLALLSYNIQNK